MEEENQDKDEGEELRDILHSNRDAMERMREEIKRLKDRLDHVEQDRQSSSDKKKQPPTA